MELRGQTGHPRTQIGLWYLTPGSQGVLGLVWVWGTLLAEGQGLTHNLFCHFPEWLPLGVHPPPLTFLKPTPSCVLSHSLVMTKSSSAAAKENPSHIPPNAHSNWGQARRKRGTGRLQKIWGHRLREVEAATISWCVCAAWLCLPLPLCHHQALELRFCHENSAEKSWGFPPFS